MNLKELTTKQLFDMLHSLLSNKDSKLSLIKMIRKIKNQEGKQYARQSIN